MAKFSWPDWLPTAPELPPPPVDPHRIEGFTNRFIAASQDALHDAPDAFFGKSGADAVEAAPAVAEQLSGLRDATLDLARNEPERQALADRLERYHSVARDDIDRHVAAQRQVMVRQTIGDRQALNLRAAGLRHNEDVLLGLAGAHAQAARALARLDGMPEEPAMAAARSAVWRSAIDQRLADGEEARALDLFERAKDVLVPADQRALEVPIQAARTDLAADQWIAREVGKDGEPLSVRLQADQGLSPAERATALAKIAARSSAQESARVVAVQAFDDRLKNATDALATQPAAYRPGTFAALANGYDDAGEAGKADSARRMARQESFLLPFARSSVAAQQRLINNLPEGEDRAAAEAIRDRQAEAFASDAFSAGIDLYPEVGPLKPIDDISGRIAQARTIASYRCSPVSPFTADENAAMRRQLAEGTRRESTSGSGYAELPPGFAAAVVQSTQDALAKDLLTLVQDVRANKKQGDAARDVELERIKKSNPQAKFIQEVRIYSPNFPEIYMVADIMFRRNGTSYLEIVEVKSGEAKLSPQQAALLAEALKTGDVYIASEEKAEELEIRPNVTFKEQKIQPWVTVTGGEHATIVRQLMDHGVDVGGRRSRFRLGVPPN